LAALTAVLVLMIAGCSRGSSTSARHDAAPPPTRPAAKDTCPAPVVPSSVGMSLVNRSLVGYSPTTLGVEEQYEGAGAWMQVFSGGYFDDITEPYDSLQESGTAAVRGVQATVLAGPYQNNIVRVALWREPGLAVPCDAHAVVASGVSEAQFNALLAELG
jgi:hypothetical protein